MKINEVQQPSVQAIFESLRADSEQPFSEDVLEEISECVANAKFTKFDSIDSFMESLERQSK